eukprot:1161555-Pelagomonas_calceolata.AAC.9
MAECAQMHFKHIAYRQCHHALLDPARGTQIAAERSVRRCISNTLLAGSTITRSWVLRVAHKSRQRGVRADASQTQCLQAVPSRAPRSC